MNGKLVVCSWMTQLIEFVVLRAKQYVCIWFIAIREMGQIPFSRRTQLHCYTHLFSNLKTIERHRKNWINASKLEKSACKYLNCLRVVVLLTSVSIIVKSVAFIWNPLNVPNTWCFRHWLSCCRCRQQTIIFTQQIEHICVWVLIWGPRVSIDSLFISFFVTFVSRSEAVLLFK